jgi:C4-dicarboxylate-specific signal transduction histidine kinase
MSLMCSQRNELPSRSVPDADTPGAPTEEKRKEEYDIRARDRELDLREREVATKEREAAAKEEELRRSRWSNPLVIGLIAAALGLFGNLTVAILNNKATQELELRRTQANLAVELIRTGDTEKVVKNLKFFLDHGLLDDPDNRIRSDLGDQSVAQHPAWIMPARELSPCGNS